MAGTHEVTNQPAPLEDWNAFDGWAALLWRSAPPPVAAAFTRSRIAGDWGHAFGTLPADTDFDALLARATPR